MHLTPPLIAWLLACAAATNLPEDLTANDVVLEGTDFIGTVPTDFGVTGVAILPDAPRVTAPAPLGVDNRTGETLVCEVWEDDFCPPLGAALDGLRTLEAGASWRLDPVGCALLDVSCLRADADPLRDVPVRAWSWFVIPGAEASP